MISCSGHDKKEEVTRFVFYAHSGFLHTDSTRFSYDTTNLDIRQYLEYELDSALKISRRRPEQKSEYFTLNPNLFKGLQDTLNKYLINNKFTKNDNLRDFSNRPIVYDGWYYTIYFKTTHQKEDRVYYIPSFSADSTLLALHNYVLNIYSFANIRRSKFEFDSIVKIDAARFYKLIPPPPIQAIPRQIYTGKPAIVKFP